MDIGLDIVYTLMKKQLLEETVPGKPLGFPSLSKMFCIVAIAAAVALSPKSTGPLAPSAAQAQTAGEFDCTLRQINLQDYGDDICLYQLHKDLAANAYWFCVERWKLYQIYRSLLIALDRIEQLLNAAENLSANTVARIRDKIDELREEAMGNYIHGVYNVLDGEWARRDIKANQRYDDCLNWED